jgi:hypothetical protein
MNQDARVKELRSQLEYCLRERPESLGRRLCSESRLGELFELGRWQVRQALDGLAKDGIIVKRRGSGTFVKRIPAFKLATPVHRSITPEELFSDNTTSEPLAMVSRTTKHPGWSIDLWGDWMSSDLSSQCTLAGMIERANHAGHRLSAHSACRGDGAVVPAEVVVDTLNTSRSHGAIFGLNYFDANEAVLKKCSKPIAVYYAGSMPAREGPVVSLDTESGIEFALRVFAREGFGRAAVIGLDTPYHPSHLERAAVVKAKSTGTIAAAEFYGCDVKEPRTCINAAKSALHAASDAIYVGDDTLLPFVAKAVEQAGLKPGHDIGIITLANRGVPLPGDRSWSRLEMDGWLFGRMIVDALTIHLDSRGQQKPSLQLRLNWVPGETHVRKGVQFGA